MILERFPSKDCSADACEGNNLMNQIENLENFHGGGSSYSTHTSG